MEFVRKYNTATHIYIPIIKRAVVDFAVGADWTPAAGDVKISIDGAAAANVTNLPSAITMGNTAYWDFSLTAGELQGKKIVVTVADSATKAVEDQSFLVVTYGNASAEYVFDLSVATQAVNLTQWKGATPADLSTNGYVLGVVMRWLTDNAGGTPNALQSNRVDSYVGAASASVETEFANALLDDARAGHTTAGTVGEAINKIMTGITGVVLASTGLDLISITDISNDADARSTFPKMVRALFNRFYNRVTNTSTQQKVYNDSNVLVATMANSDDGTTQEKGKSA